MWAGLVEKEELGRREARKAVPTRAEAAGRMRWCHDIGGEGGEGGIWGRERMGKKWGKNCQCRGEEACAAERGLGLNKANW